MEKVYLSLGSNIGDKVLNLKKATELLKNSKNILDVRSSSFYETEPQGYKDQDFFINCVVECFTALSPKELLKITQGIEKELKRVKLFRWGPRIIDVDILLYGEKSLDTPVLTIPHPRMYERAFVMVPLCELNNSFSNYTDNLKDQFIKVID